MRGSWGVWTYGDPDFDRDPVIDGCTKTDSSVDLALDHPQWLGVAGPEVRVVGVGQSRLWDHDLG